MHSESAQRIGDSHGRQPKEGPAWPAGDIATHAVGKSSDNVENATDIARGDVAGGTGRIVKNSIDIATHSDRTH